MDIQKVAFISRELPYPNLVTHALFPEYGMPLVATIVRNAGYTVRVFVENLGPIDWDWVLGADVVCFHAFSATMPKTIDAIRKIKEVRPGMPIVIGGVHASVMAEDTLRYCDVVVRQEGDESLLEALEQWRKGESLSRVLGVSYRENGVVRHNPDRPFTQNLDTIPDLSLINGYLSWNKLKLLTKLKMRWQVLQTSRGCPFACSFCVAPRELGRGYRMRDIDRVIEDIKYQKALTGARHFFIVDNHFTVNRARAKALLQRIIAEKIDWSAICFTRLEVARDEELLKLLKEAKINTLYVGLESFDNRVLKLLNKAQTSEDIVRSIKTIKAHGLRALGSFVLGSDEDTVESIRATIDAAIHDDLDTIALFPLSGYPEHNSPTIPLRRFFLPSWDRLDGNFVVFFPKNMRPSTLQREVNRGYRRFYSLGRATRRLLSGDWWGGLRTFFYAFRSWEMRRHTELWARYLETIEAPYYDEREQLIEERLGEGVHPAAALGSFKAANLEGAAIVMGVR